MTENLKLALVAINKWLFFGWNFKSCYHSWQDFSGVPREEYLPEFLCRVKWTCNLSHMVDKWRKATRSKNPDTYLVSFYADLDNANRILLLEWVMQNYNGEKTLI